MLKQSIKRETFSLSCNSLDTQLNFIQEHLYKLRDLDVSEERFLSLFFAEISNLCKKSSFLKVFPQQGIRKDF